MPTRIVGEGLWWEGRTRALAGTMPIDPSAELGRTHQEQPFPETHRRFEDPAATTLDEPGQPLRLASCAGALAVGSEVFPEEEQVVLVSQARAEAIQAECPTRQ
jgi:hypothetical protein